MPKTEIQLRWYQIPIVWLVIGIPLFSIVFTLSIVWISVKTFDGVVVDDYYKRGLEINRELARDRYADEVNLKASVRFEDEQLLVEMSGDAAEIWPEMLELGFYHPTVSNRDVVVKLEHQGSGTYFAPAPALRFGKWNVVTGTENWRLEGNLFHPDNDGFILRPIRVGDAVR